MKSIAVDKTLNKLAKMLSQCSTKIEGNTLTANVNYMGVQSRIDVTIKEGNEVLVWVNKDDIIPDVTETINDMIKRIIV